MVVPGCGVSSRKCEAITGPSRRVWNSGTGHGSPLFGNPFPSHHAVSAVHPVFVRTAIRSPWSDLVGAVPSDEKRSSVLYMAENVGQKEGRLPERSADFGRGGPWGSRPVHLSVDDWDSAMGTNHRVRMHFSQTGKAISKRFCELEPHRRVGAESVGFANLAVKECEMHDEG